jgi:hypothetical protein
MEIKKSKKIKNIYDYRFRCWNQIDFENDQYGFDGYYTNKDLGLCQVYLTQDCSNNYHLILNVWKSGYKHARTIELYNKCTHLFAAIQAKKFLEELNDEVEDG